MRSGGCGRTKLSSGKGNVVTSERYWYVENMNRTLALDCVVVFETAVS